MTDRMWCVGEERESNCEWKRTEQGNDYVREGGSMRDRVKGISGL